MSASSDSDQQEAQILYAWNPMTASVRQRMRDRLLRTAATIPMRRSRFRRWWHLASLWMASDPMRGIFWSLSIGPCAAAVVIVIAGWPVLGAESSQHVGIVLAAGSATAFGSIVFSVSSTLFTRAADIAPGYTAVILGRRSPWVSGIGIIAVSGLLLLAAAFEPTRSGAVAAVLVAISSVSWSWMSARKALADSDPLIIAQHAGRYYRKAVLRSARYAKVSLASGWPKGIRKNREAVDALTRDHQRHVVGGLLRQIRAGIRGTAGQGRLTEAVMLFEALCAAFVDYAETVDGEIGPHDGLLEIVLSAADSVISNSILHSDNEAANYGLQQLCRIAEPELRDPEFAAVRALVFRRLQQYLNDSWDNDVTTVPAAAVSSMSQLTRTWVSIRAFQDVPRVLEALGTTAIRAISTGRKHIGYEATGQLAALLPVVAREDHAALRTGYLNQWSESVGSTTLLSPAEPSDGMASVTDALIPGITLARGPSLQETMWQVRLQTVPHVATALLDALDRYFSMLSRLDDEEIDDLIYERTLTDGLALTYGVTLLLFWAREEQDVANLASRALKLAVEVSPSGLGERRTPSSDVAELTWSILLTVSAAGIEDNKLRSAASLLVERMGVLDEWRLPPINAGYIVAFIEGLLVVAGRPEGEINAWVGGVMERQEERSSHAWIHLEDWGMHIDGLGRAPSVNRNRVAVNGFFETINSAAVTKWPRLAESQTSGLR